MHFNWYKKITIKKPEVASLNDAHDSSDYYLFQNKSPYYVIIAFCPYYKYICNWGVGYPKLNCNKAFVKRS